MEPGGKELKNYPLKNIYDNSIEKKPFQCYKKKKTFTGLVTASIERSVMWSPPVCWISHFAYVSWYFPQRPG